MRELVRLLKPGGQALIYVWAFEQEYNKQKSKYLKDQNKERPENHGPFYSTPQDRHLADNYKPVDEIQDVSKVTNSKLSVHTNRTAFNTQDLLVPWHLKEGKRRVEGESEESRMKDKTKEKSRKTFGNSCSTSSVTSKTRLDFTPDPSPGCDPSMSSGSFLDTSDATHSPHDTTQTSSSIRKSESESSPAPIFHRYYHVFQQGELEQLCVQVAGVKVQSSYHDQGNWCVILEKQWERRTYTVIYNFTNKICWKNISMSHHCSCNVTED